jgi:hypothetical protein
VTVPFLGGIVDMVKDPHAFWERQRAYAFPGLSVNSIVTKFTVMVTDPATIRHVFNHNRCGAGRDLVLALFAFREGRRSGRRQRHSRRGDACRRQQPWAQRGHAAAAP